MSDVNKISVSDSNYEQHVEGWLEDSDIDPNYAIQSDHDSESDKEEE
jgi:hypothetical protein